MKPSRTLYYYRTRLGTVVATSLGGGVFGAGYRYTAYGEVELSVNETDATRSELGYTNALRLTGSLLYLKNRVYDPEARVFVQPETVDRLRYAYVTGDPVNLSDPTGLEADPNAPKYSVIFSGTNVTIVANWADGSTKIVASFNTEIPIESQLKAERARQGDAVALQTTQQNPDEQAATSPPAQGVTRASVPTTTPASPGNPKAMAPPANTVGLGGVVVTVKLREGAWGSSTTVWHPGTEARTFANTTSVGDNGKELLPGAYYFVVGRHPLGDVAGKTPYTALNLYTRDWSRELPATVDGERTTIKGGNFHFGNRPDSPNGAGSQGCHVCPKSDWNRFINLFYASGERGTYIYIDLSGRRP